MKTTLLSVFAIAATVSVNAQYIVEADFSSADAFASNSGALEIAADGEALTITSAAGHDEWDSFEFTFPASAVTTTDTIRVTVKAENTSPDSLQPIFDITLVDADNVAVLNPAAQAVTRFTTESEYVDYKFVISQFYDEWVSAGPVDSNNIVKIRMAVNAGFISFPPQGSDGKARGGSFVGVLSINHLTIGEMEVGISDITIAKDYSVFPNPTEGVLNIQFDGLEDATTVEVRNVLGAVVWSDLTAAGQYNNTVEMDEAGVYFVSVRANGVAQTSKVIVK